MPDKLHGLLQSSWLWWRLWYQEGFLVLRICPCFLAQHTGYLPPVKSFNKNLRENPALCILPYINLILPFENHRSRLLSHEPLSKCQMSWSAISKSLSKLAFSWKKAIWALLSKEQIISPYLLTLPMEHQLSPHLHSGMPEHLSFFHGDSWLGDALHF